MVCGIKIPRSFAIFFKAPPIASSKAFGRGFRGPFGKTLRKHRFQLSEATFK